jgi:transposase
MEMPRIALRLCPDEWEDVRKLRVVLKKAGEHRLDLRLRAVQLLSGGASIDRTAGMCEVGTTTVKRWLHTYRVEGAWALISKGPYQGKKPRLSDEQLKELEDIIEAGPEASGLDTGVWTSPIIADLVRRRFGIKYHPSQIRRILHKQGFSIQYPKQRLSLADKALQGLWIRKELPAIKKSPERARRAAV